MLTKPLYRAVHELDGQLDLLLRQVCPARDNTQRRCTRKTLDTIVGLSRYFPVAHPVHDGSRKLAAVCVPLLADPASAVRRKLPEFCFRVMQELVQSPQQSLRIAMLEQLQQYECSLSSGLPAGEVKSAGLSRQLMLLGSFLDLDESARLFAFSLSDSSLQNDAKIPDPLVALLRGQYQLRLAVLMQDQPPKALPALLLQPWLQQQRDAIASHCGNSTWTLAFYCESGLADLLHESSWLAMFSGDSSHCISLRHLAAQLLELHLAGSKPDRGTLQALLCRLFSLSTDGLDQRQTFARDTEESTQVAEENGSQQINLNPELGLLLTAELGQYRDALLVWLNSADTAHFSSLDELTRVLYKLRWVFAAAGNEEMKIMAGLTYQLCAQYWFIGLALPADVLVVLQQLSTLIIPENPRFVSSAACRNLQRQLLQAWPGTCRDAGLQIALASDGPGSVPSDPAAGSSDDEINEPAAIARTAVVSLQVVPALLSASFTTLVQLPARRVTVDMPTAQRDIVVQELALLEKGAAALKIWPLEHLCILLLESYQVLERQQSSYPAELLRNAHAELVGMLDQAAAWQQTDENQVLISQLRRWLDQQSTEFSLRKVQGSTEELALLTLHERLQAYVKSLALAIEKPVRMQFGKCSGNIPATAMAQVEGSLKVLLRFILLDNSATGPSRRAVHKPLISTVCVDLRQTESGLSLHIFEDSSAPPVTPEQLQQLQRRLPVTATTISSTSQAGRGRSFHYRLSLAAPANSGPAIPSPDSIS